MATEDTQTNSIIKIDKSTLVPIGLLVSVVVCAVYTTMWIQGTILDLKHDSEIRSVQTINSLNEIKNKVDVLTSNVSTLTSERWTIEDMKIWVKLLQSQNQSLHVPEAARSH